MEFVSGYRDPMLEFSELLFRWYRVYLSECSGWISRRVRSKEREGAIKELLSKPVSWTLHVLPNKNISFHLKNPELQIDDAFYSDDVLHLGDLDKYINLVYLEGESPEDVSAREECERGLKCGFGAGGKPPPLTPHSQWMGKRRYLPLVGGWACGQHHPSFASPLYRIDYVLVVVEETGSVLGVDFLVGADLHERADASLWGVRVYHLLCQCMVRPMGAGAPRRPKSIAVGETTVHDFLGNLLPPLGIHLMEKPFRGWMLTPSFSLSSSVVRSCHVCKRRSFEAALSPCGHCRAVLYCSETCKSQDWNKRPADISHGYWCGKMVQYMELAPKLAELPFSFTKEVTSPTFDKERFLSTKHLTESYWMAETLILLPWVPYPHAAPPGGAQSPRCSSRGRPIPTLLLQGAPNPHAAPPGDAQSPRCSFRGQYYNWRRLDLDNPIAVLLTSTLTIYHVITRMVPRHFPDINILKKQSLKIHIIDGKREYESIELLWELAVLMPCVLFEVTFVGDSLPVEEDNRHFVLHRKGSKLVCTEFTSPYRNKGERGIQVKIHAQPYHTLQGAKPDLVIGFNAGFGLKDAWLSILPRLQFLKVPAYFSECSQYSCEVDGQIVAVATGGTASDPFLNPFRSPLRIWATDNCMPWYSNAFLFHLIYKTSNGKQRHPAPPARAVPDQEPAPDPAACRKKKKGGRKNNKKHK
uniref:Zinc finger MYND-type containing 15 n=1 Tax=Leptobrachium leishanense TaxID=445787 RepID=A0A8C5LSB3_9ANUR